MSAHSLFAPSSAPAIADCRAYLRENAGKPDDSNYYSVEGTVAHAVADKCFVNNCNAATYAGEIHEHVINGIVTEIPVDDDMVEHVQSYLDWCREVPGDSYPERKVEHTKWCPPPELIKAFCERHGLKFEAAQKGTCDYAVCEPGVLTITDFKYGQGVQVWAKENDQAILYALGFWLEFNWAYDFKKIVIRICQPRLDHFDVWETTAEELLRYGTKIKHVFIEALAEDAPYNPTEKACKFCTVRKSCKALREKINSAHALAFDYDTQEFTPPVDELDLAEMVEAWHTHKLYDIRFTAIEQHLAKVVLSGQHVPGMKLVEGRSNRRWSNPTKGIEVMQQAGIVTKDMYVRRLIGPAKAEKLLPKARRELIYDAVVKPAGQPTLVSENDPRPVYGSKFVNAFDIEDDDLDGE